MCVCVFGGLISVLSRAVALCFIHFILTAVRCIDDILSSRIYTCRYVQWDDWQWTNPETGKNMDVPGIVDFPPNKQAVPDGLTDWLGMPTSLYAPMWSANNSYRDQYRWIADTDVGTDAGAAIPVDIDFYRDVFKNGSHAQMKMFEQDFLCYYGWLTNLTNSDVSAGMEWLHALNAAAAEANITVQLCMMQPTHALASTELTVVTNGRGTSDNSHGGAADLYALGTSGMLLGAMGLWSSRDGLFFRDQTYMNKTAPDGEHHVYWGRGNGWAAGALARALEYTPTTHPAYAIYADHLRAMAKSLAAAQSRGDGMWRADILDPNDDPTNKETTGSAGMAFGLAYGVNSGVLDARVYKPVVLKAWEGLQSVVHGDGRLGYCQPVGGGPAKATADDTSDFCVGLWLLAASEVAKM